MSDILCSHYLMRPGQYNACQQEAIGLIRWTTQMSPSWTIQTTRAYCREHLDGMRAGFNRAHLPYELLKLGE